MTTVTTRSERSDTAQQPTGRTRQRSRVTGSPEVLEAIATAQHSLREALEAASTARTLRGHSIRAALEGGWSIRGLAEALGVEKRRVQEWAEKG